MTLTEAQDIVSDQMDCILRCFKPGAKITVTVRTPGYPDRDFCMTNDDLPEVKKLIDRHIAADAQL
jgi:hypothetical protein